MMFIWKKQCVTSHLLLEVIGSILFTVGFDSWTVYIAYTKYYDKYFLATAILLGVTVPVWIITLLGIYLHKAWIVLFGEFCMLVDSVYMATIMIMNFTASTWHIGLTILASAGVAVMRLGNVINFHSMYRKLSDENVDE